MTAGEPPGFDEVATASWR